MYAQLRSPMAMRRLDGSHSRGTFQVAVVGNSDLPGLLGVQSMWNRRAILDMNTFRPHARGPGDYNLDDVLPPGTKSFQCAFAPSGQMVLPCRKYAGVDI